MKEKIFYYFLCIFIMSSQYSYSYIDKPGVLVEVEYSSDPSTFSADFEYSESDIVNEVIDFSFDETDNKVVENLIKEIKSRYPKDTKVLDEFLNGDIAEYTNENNISKNSTILMLLRNIVAKNAYTELKEQALNEIREKSEKTGRRIHKKGNLTLFGSVYYTLGEDDLPDSCFETKTNKYGAKVKFQICPYNEGFEDVGLEIRESKKDDNYYGDMFFMKDDKDEDLTKVISVEFEGENEITKKSLNTQAYLDVVETHRSYKDYAKERDIGLKANICNFYGEENQSCAYLSAPAMVSTVTYDSIQEMKLRASKFDEE